MKQNVTDVALLKRGLKLEYFTLLWNIVGIFVLAVAAFRAHSIALGGFGLDSLIEIGASIIVIWELTNTKKDVRAKALRMIGIGFYLIALYIFLEVTYMFIRGTHPDVSGLGIIWTAITCAVMLLLAHAKRITGVQLHNPVLVTEGKVTLIDAYLAASVLAGLLINAVFHIWAADLMAALIIVYYGVKEGRAAFREAKQHV